MAEPGGPKLAWELGCQERLPRGGIRACFGTHSNIRPAKGRGTYGREAACAKPQGLSAAGLIPKGKGEGWPPASGEGWLVGVSLGEGGEAGVQVRGRD